MNQVHLNGYHTLWSFSQPMSQEYSDGKWWVWPRLDWVQRENTREAPCDTGTIQHHEDGILFLPTVWRAHWNYPAHATSGKKGISLILELIIYESQFGQGTFVTIYDISNKKQCNFFKVHWKNTLQCKESLKLFTKCFCLLLWVLNIFHNEKFYF